MAVPYIKEDLENLADALQVHPRTILRAVENNPAAYWVEGYHVRLNIDEVARAFNGPPRYLRWALDGTDQLITQTQAAEELGIPGRTFRYRHYKVAYKRGGIVRFSRRDLLTEHYAKWD
jgi:hypothetical protein